MAFLCLTKEHKGGTHVALKMMDGLMIYSPCRPARRSVSSSLFPKRSQRRTCRDSLIINSQTSGLWKHRVVTHEALTFEEIVWGLLGCTQSAWVSATSTGGGSFINICAMRWMWLHSEKKNRCTTVYKKQQRVPPPISSKTTVSYGRLRRAASEIVMGGLCFLYLLPTHAPRKSLRLYEKTFFFFSIQSYSISQRRLFLNESGSK